MREDAPIAIVGGGIAGLAAAFELSSRGAPFVLFEAGPRFGGVIRSERVDGFLLEAGPDTLLAQKPEALRLCREVGLEGDLVPTNPDQRTLFVVHGRRLHPLPDGMVLGVPTRLGPLARSALFTWPGKLRMACDLVIPARRAGGDESIASFFRRRLGAEALARLGGPFLAGIHAGDPDRLSIRSTFPRLVEMEQQHGGLIRGLLAARPRTASPPPPMFYSLRDGLGEMVKALVARLPAGRLRARAGVGGLVRDNEGFTLRLESGEDVRASAVVLAVPAPRAAELIRALDEEAGRLLGGIRFASSAAVYLGYRREDVTHPLDGYGLIVAEREGLRTSACSFFSTKFPGRAPEGHVLLRGFVGGARDDGALLADDRELVERVHGEMAPLLGLAAPPMLTRIYRWPCATPQMEVGHSSRMDVLERRLAAIPGLVLTGAGLRVTGVPDTIADARRAAATALTPAPEPPAAARRAAGSPPAAPSP
jgi:protoporphyrinogen/coproporphyrinogen III oxidase